MWPLLLAARQAGSLASSLEACWLASAGWHFSSLSRAHTKQMILSRKDAAYFLCITPIGINKIWVLGAFLANSPVTTRNAYKEEECEPFFSLLKP